MLETSEDEEQKKKDAAKAKGAVKLEAHELAMEINITLSESETTTLFHVPGIIVASEGDEASNTTKQTKQYTELCNKKISSDAFIEHGTQTINLTQKTREIDFEGITQESKSFQATNWDIDDARHAESITSSKKEEMLYLNMVEEILVEKSKHKAAFIDAENLASHISIGSETQIG